MSGRILIVGAGIVGLCTAHALTRRGLKVTLIEQGPVPNPIASSTDHHRMIRYTYGAERVYCRRIAQAFHAWRGIWADLPRGEDAYYAETGVLTVSQQPGDWADLSRQTLEAEGIAFERIDGAPALNARFAHLDLGNIAYGLLSPGGALMGNRIMVDLADWLRGQGAEVLEHSPVTGIDPAQARVTLASGRDLQGDLVIVTAGVGLRALVPDMAPRLRPTRTLILYAEPPGHLAEAWASAPCWSDLGGEMELWGIAPVHGLPPKLGAGAFGRADETDDDRQITGEEITRILAAYRGRFRDIDEFSIRFGQANYWTWAPEERFQIERQDRMIAASACSGHGFKFGALSGLDIAALAVGEETVGQIRPRFMGLEAGT
ncbi:MAG: FAD-dependent oxidoreductase [Pseudomonadota bacterium]